MRRSRLALRLLSFLVPGTLLGQAAPERAPRPLPRDGMAEHPETFSRIKQVAALSDGRLVVGDASEKKVLLLDFSSRTSRALARSGQGPKEFRTPGGSYPARGGGVLLYDQQERRFLPVLANGSVGDAIALPMTVNTVNVSEQGNDQFVPDSLGNFFSAERSLGSDRTPVSTLVRYDAGGVPTTLGTLRLQDGRQVGGSQPGVIMRQMVRFSPADVWSVAPDGWVAVVSAAPYRVRWFPPRGPAIEGRAIPFTPLPVTEADREAARAEQSRRSAEGATLSIGGRDGQRTQTIRPPSVEPLFADAKPAFPIHVPGIDPAGRVWIQRYVPAGAEPVFDVIDRTGALVDRITTPIGTRLVGFGPGVVYLARTDEDDLVHLQRHRLP